MPMRPVELSFKRWLDSKNYPYLCIDNSIDTMPEFFRGITKRPDFLLVIKHLGIIAIDVKEGEPYRGQDFVLDEKEEVIKYLQFERIMRLPVWFVFGSQNYQYSTWYWIPLSKVLECELRASSRTGDRFRAIPPSACIALQADRDGISRIID